MNNEAALSSYHLDSNTGMDLSRDDSGKPLNGTVIKIDRIIRRYRNGLLDGDTLAESGRVIVQPAVEGPGHEEYWRKGFLHRDNGEPAVISNGFVHREWWENGKFIKAEGVFSRPSNLEGDDTSDN